MSPEDKKLKVLFVCTGNVCRSQMAQAWVGHLKGDRIDAYSAGSPPAGFVSDRVVKVMKEVGVDMSNHWSKPIDHWSDVDFDYVVTLCEYAREFCPVFPGPTRMVHHPVPDPMGIIGTDEMTLGAFRKVRDMIKEYVESLPEALES